MSLTYLFDKVAELKDKFKTYCVSKKKLQALDNYSQVAPFRHGEYLNLIKKCMDRGFVGDKEADFLGYLIDKYEVNFLDWSHKTKWLKSQMSKMAYENNKGTPIQMTIFDFLKPEHEIPKVPFEVLAMQQKQSAVRRV